MARQPKYRLHKFSGQAFVEIKGRRVYLGKYGSEESRAKYHRLLAEAAVGGIAAPGPRITVAELLVQFFAHVRQRYQKNGKPTTEVNSYRFALRPVKALYGFTPVEEFGPLALIACRQALLEKGYCRKRVNGHVYRIRNAFKWGVSRELVKAETWQALRSVDGLRKGEARDNAKVLPVEWHQVEAIKPHVTPQIWAMVELQWWCGCRPGEAAQVRMMDLDTSGDIWTYTPESHKTEHHDLTRVVLIGPRGQDVLRPWFRCNLSEYLFQPREGWLSYIEGIRKRPGKRRITKRFEATYTPAAYCIAIHRACKKAGVEQWSPNQLRHAAATRIRRDYGLELSRIILGHQSAVTTEVYAEADREKAAEVIRRVG
jgi:integrase